MPFKVGDRVVRGIDVNGSLWLRGQVVEVYLDTLTNRNTANTLYAVLWDGAKKPERGYLEIGLKREPLNLGYIGAIL